MDVEEDTAVMHGVRWRGYGLNFEFWRSGFSIRMLAVARGITGGAEEGGREVCGGICR